ncbi:MAG: hypothetical protein NVSMB6_23200 [Burkholderiaceae bacterium]
MPEPLFEDAVSVDAVAAEGIVEGVGVAAATLDMVELDPEVGPEVEADPEPEVDPAPDVAAVSAVRRLQPVTTVLNTAATSTILDAIKNVSDVFVSFMTFPISVRYTRMNFRKNAPAR